MIRSNGPALARLQWAINCNCLCRLWAIVPGGWAGETESLM